MGIDLIFKIALETNRLTAYEALYDALGVCINYTDIEPDSEESFTERYSNELILCSLDAEIYLDIVPGIVISVFIDYDETGLIDFDELTTLKNDIQEEIESYLMNLPFDLEIQAGVM